MFWNSVWNSVFFFLKQKHRIFPTGLNNFKHNCIWRHDEKWWSRRIFGLLAVPKLEMDYWWNPISVVNGEYLDRFAWCWTVSPPGCRHALQCKDCGERFSELSALQGHKAVMHAVESPGLTYTNGNVFEGVSSHMRLCPLAPALTGWMLCFAFSF